MRLLQIQILLILMVVHSMIIDFDASSMQGFGGLACSEGPCARLFVCLSARFGAGSGAFRLWGLGLCCFFPCFISCFDVFVPLFH